MSDTGKLHSEQALPTGASQQFQRVAETMKSAADTAAEGMARTAETISASQHTILSKASEELAETSRKIFEKSRGNAEVLRTLMTLPSAAEGGLQDMQRSVVGLVQGVVRTNLTLMEEMFKVKSPQAYIDLQHRFVREYLDGLLEGVTMLVRATRRTADETLRPLEQRTRSSVE
jgi:hypothetical protein